MPTLSPENVFLVYSFNTLEWTNARILTDLQLARLQTVRAQLMMQKATTLVPEDLAADRSYQLKQAEVQGIINFITHDLMDEHFAALKELNDPNKVEEQNATSPNIIDDLATRASKLVNKTSDE